MYFFARDELMWVAGHGEWEKLIQGQINEGELFKLEYCKWQVQLPVDNLRTFCRETLKYSTFCHKYLDSTT